MRGISAVVAGGQAVRVSRSPNEAPKGFASAFHSGSRHIELDHVNGLSVLLIRQS